MRREYEISRGKTTTYGTKRTRIIEFKNLRIMKYFDIDREFRCKDGSVMPEEVKVNLTALVEKVLDPARERFGNAIRVNSGWRSEAYNKSIGGAANSQHCKGQAADLAAEPKNYSSMMSWKVANLEIARAIVKGRDWDQMILYVDKSGELLPRFIHVSWKKDGINRREIRKKVYGGAPVYPLLSKEEMKMMI